jgi:electron transfer flavoprotein alpha subunit
MRILALAFAAHELPSCRAFCQAVGGDFDILLVEPIGDLPPADAVAEDLTDQSRFYDLIAAPQTLLSLDILPRVAGLMDSAMVTGVTGVVGPGNFQRPALNGRVLETVEAQGSPVFVTFRPHAFPDLNPGDRVTHKSQEMRAFSEIHQFGTTISTPLRSDAANASIVVAGGRAFQDSESFQTLIGGLAEVLGGATGASKGATDNHAASPGLVIGQSGKTVAPNLYLAAGISGASQHLAGIRDSKTIVAINHDSNAPIFENADLGLVADVYKALPELIEALKHR